MTEFCEECGANLGQTAASIMHPSLDSSTILCGMTGKRANVTEVRPVPVMVASTLDAPRRELAVVVDALAYHASHEDTPVEVNTDGGWVDMIDLLQPLIKSLEVSTDG